jgi:hypothetical protein
MTKIDLIIDALTVANSALWSARIDEALFVARELKLELTNRKWVGLTEDEINKIANSPQPFDETSSGYVLPFAKAIQAKLKEKNGGNR